MASVAPVAAEADVGGACGEAPPDGAPMMVLMPGAPVVLPSDTQASTAAIAPVASAQVPIDSAPVILEAPVRAPPTAAPIDSAPATLSPPPADEPPSAVVLEYQPDSTPVPVASAQAPYDSTPVILEAPAHAPPSAAPPDSAPTGAPEAPPAPRAHAPPPAAVPFDREPVLLAPSPAHAPPMPPPAHAPPAAVPRERAPVILPPPEYAPSTAVVPLDSAPLILAPPRAHVPPPMTPPVAHAPPLPYAVPLLAAPMLQSDVCTLGGSITVPRVPRRAATMVDSNGDGRADLLLIDSTGDGVPDKAISCVAVDTTGDGRTDALIADADGDGRGDCLVLDRTKDGIPDTAVPGVLVDTDGDGQANVLLVDTTEDGHADTLVHIYGTDSWQRAPGQHHFCGGAEPPPPAGGGASSAAALMGVGPMMAGGVGAMMGSAGAMMMQQWGVPAESQLSLKRAVGPNGEPLGGKHGWTREEDETIVRMVQITGQKWARIAEALPGRTDDAVRNRYLRLQRKRPYDAPGAIVTADGLDELGTQKKGDMWTPEEDTAIMEGVARYGLKWQTIAQSLPGRSANAVRNRYLRCLPH